MNNLTCGVDISKDTAHFSLMGPDGKPLSGPVVFTNDPPGFKKALKWLRKLAKPLKPFEVHLAMEATGVYYLSLAKFFHREKGFVVSVVNPAQVKSYAGAELVRTKTDGVDATVIARFTAALPPRPWSPPPPHEEEMMTLLRHMEAIKDMVQAEKNRLHAMEVAGPHTLNVRKAVKKHIRFLEKQIDDLTDKLRKLVKEHPEMAEKVRLLCSIPGVGETTAQTLLAEIGDISRFSSAKKLVAYAGIAPAERQSGTSLKGRPMIDKKGSKRLRKALYMPAMVAARFNPVIKAFYMRLVEAGKKPILALVACMRKLLHIVYGILKNKKPFDPDWNNAKTT